AMAFGLTGGLLSLLIAMSITIPSIYLGLSPDPDDIIEIIGIFIVGLVVILWFDSYYTDKRNRQQAYIKLETAQRELQRMQQNLRYYLKQITIAQEEERRRIAQELHDDTAQDLIVLSRRLDGYRSNNKNLSNENITYLDEMQQQINRTLSEVRRFSQDLRPSVLDDLGLIPALEWLLPELGKHFDLLTSLEIKGVVQRFPPETELVLFRIVQESLRNIGKHANATEATLTILNDENNSCFIIKDNGGGFKPPERIGDLAAGGKLGLVGMEERARLIGSILKIDSLPGKGTTITIEVAKDGKIIEEIDNY
ncbi:MAG: sensor histidine kinase, partial [Chloroflexi bacterium]|nr:sensor histidine kinase [Chloroflexota bacterium]